MNATTTMSWMQLEAVQPYQLPMILLTYKPSFISNLIRAYDGEWSHAIWLHKKVEGVNYVASQDWRFHESPLDRYFGHDMAIYEYERGWDGDDARYKQTILDCIARQVAHRGLYDVLGVLSYLIRCPSINNPRAYYCTEAVWKGFQAAYGLEDMKMTPSQLGDWLSTHGWKMVGLRKAERKNGGRK